MLKRLKIALLVLACLIPLSASAMVQQHPLHSPATSLASAYDTAESIFPDTPSDPHETLVIIEYSDGSVLSYTCRNNPMGGYDALGLAVRTSPAMGEALQAIFGYGNVTATPAGDGFVDLSMTQASRDSGMRSASYGSSQENVLHFGALSAAMLSDKLYTLGNDGRTLSLDPSYVPFAGNPSPAPLRCPDAENPERLLVPIALTGLMTGGTVYLQMGPELITASMISRFGPAVAGAGDLARRSWCRISDAYYRAGAWCSYRTDMLKRTIWDSVKPTQQTIQGTSIPKSFELATESGKFWVHPNATKHMAEYMTRNGLSHTTSISSQSMLQSFQSAVNQAVAQGIRYGEIMRVGRWELIFSEGRTGGALPVIKHALYK